MPPQNTPRVEQLLPPPHTRVVICIPPGYSVHSIERPVPVAEPSVRVFGILPAELWERIAELVPEIGEPTIQAEIGVALLECRMTKAPLDCDEFRQVLHLAGTLTTYLTKLRDDAIDALDKVPAGSTMSPRAATFGNLWYLKRVSTMLTDVYAAIDAATPREEVGQ